MKKVRVSIINYSNTIPFVYGLLTNKELIEQSDFLYHYPSQGVELLNSNDVDISLVPVAAIPDIVNGNIITNFCISAYRNVESVLLCSNTPLENISHITLDYQSRSSNLLVTILAKFVWKISPTYSVGKSDYELQNDDSAKVIIGDRAMAFRNKYSYTYDLAYEWYKAYNLPFVFACWVSNKKLPISYLELFEASLLNGVSNINQAIQYTNKTFDFDIFSYLHNSIQYELTEQKKQAMELFYSKAKLLS